MRKNRYIRQELLHEIGKSGQKKLRNVHICIIGCGGLGSIAAPYLAGAGISTITLADGDQPDITNVHRQVFFTGTETSTKSKVLADHLKKLNPEITINVFSEMVSKDNISDITKGCDLVLECTDDMMTKYLVNDFCHLNRIPLVYGAIFKYEGYVSLFNNKDQDQIHLRDIFPTPNLDVPTCSEVGVLSTIAGMIGLLQANEALKNILDIGTSLDGQLLTYNALSNDQFKLNLQKNYREDLAAIYQSTSYHTVDCEIVPEISVADWIANKENYKVISVLEKKEHESITDDVIHMPFSRFNLGAWQENEPVVFYCQSGLRSAKLVKIILDNYPEANVQSLKGGLIAYNDFNSSN